MLASASVLGRVELGSFGVVICVGIDMFIVSFTVQFACLCDNDVCMSTISGSVLAAAGGVETHSNRNWLPVAELRRSLVKVLATSTEVGCNKKDGIMVPMFFELFM